MQILSACLALHSANVGVRTSTHEREDHRHGRNGFDECKHNNAFDIRLLGLGHEYSSERDYRNSRVNMHQTFARASQYDNNNPYIHRMPHIKCPSAQSEHTHVILCFAKS